MDLWVIVAHSNVVVTVARTIRRIQWDSDRMTAADGDGHVERERGPPSMATDCDALREEIKTLQKEFETLWLAVSTGTPPSKRYRELRRTIDELRAKAAAECPPAKEDSDLPRHITADWSAG
jgi:hypothetical protein